LGTSAWRPSASAAAATLLGMALCLILAPPRLMLTCGKSAACMASANSVRAKDAGHCSQLGAVQADSVDLWGGVDWTFVDRVVAHKV